MQSDIEQIEAAGIQVVGISYDSVDELKAFAEKRGITFPLLSDPESKAISAYGVLNDGDGGNQAGIPHPGTFVVNSEGNVHAFLPGSVRERHSTDAPGYIRGQQRGQCACLPAGQRP